MSLKVYVTWKTKDPVLSKPRLPKVYPANIRQILFLVSSLKPRAALSTHSC
jgi:hypothetical protein